ncbi:MAG: tail fiber domain-containing protein [Verrucomicrobia bacterium]|nr:tail fiber domain-containing protein [Verrucomicrobiota bacterium]
MKNKRSKIFVLILATLTAIALATPWSMGQKSGTGVTNPGGGTGTTPGDGTPGGGPGEIPGPGPLPGTRDAGPHFQAFTAEEATIGDLEVATLMADMASIDSCTADMAFCNELKAGVIISNKYQSEDGSCVIEQQMMGGGMGDWLNLSCPYAILLDAPDTYVDGNLHVSGRAQCDAGLSCSGNLTCDGAQVGGEVVARQFTTESSRNLKKNIKPIDNALDKITRLNGVTFNWKSGSPTRSSMGLIAEEVAEVLPELVTQKEDGQSVQGLNYSGLVAVAVEGMKEQQHQIDTLRQENRALKETLATLQAEMAKMAARIEALAAQPSN